MQKMKKNRLVKSLILILSAALWLSFSAEAQRKKVRPKPKGKISNKVAHKKPAFRPLHPVSSIMVSNPVVVRSQAAFTFTNRWYDFGDIVQGEKVTYTFSFKNTGKEPLIINTVQPTCGCTVTEWPHKPILPGQSGEIKVTFDSKSALNQQNKTITIISNALTGNERLYLRGNVLPKR